MKKAAVVFLMISLFVAASAWPQPKFEATLERENVSVGNPVYLYLTFYGAQDVDRPQIYEIDGLKVQYVGPSTRTQIVNGRVSQSITFTYLLIPLKEGEFELGPFTTAYGGQPYRTETITLEASTTPGPVQAVTPAPYSGSATVQAQAPDMGDRIFLTMEIPEKTVYVNESAPLIIKVYVNDMGLRDIEYPRVSYEGFSTGEHRQPERRTEVVRGMRYEVLVFTQDLFAIKEGDYALGPAKLSCKMVVRKETPRRSSFFGRSIFDDDFFSSKFGYDTYPIELESNVIPVKILPFPREKKPADFQGAVGDFTMEAHIEPFETKVGDPVVLRMAISGMGNLDTVTAPRVTPGDDFKTYEPQVTKKGGKKIYEQILIPKSDKIKEVPKVSFSFFNPRTGKYETLEKGPFPLKVVEQPLDERKAKMVSMAGIEQMLYPQEELGKDIIYIKEYPGKLARRGSFLYNNLLFWGVQAVPLALFSVFYFNYRKKERILTDRTYARSLKAPRRARAGLAKARAYLDRNEVVPFYDAIFKTLQEYLGNRFDLPKGGVTVAEVEERLGPSGRDEEVLAMLKEVFSMCEMARYASSVPGGEEGKEILGKVRRVIDYMEKVKIK
jgi:hypothetical protein